jgi:hypothetical protein
MIDRRLLPREHGAYAQLGFPLLSGLLLGSPGAAAWLFAATAAALFVANEPAALLTGVRGERQRGQLARAARGVLALCMAAAVAGGTLALWLAPVSARWLALVPAALAAGLLPFVLRRKLKTLAGEAIAAAAFAAMHLPVAAAGGVTGTLLWGPPLMWFASTVAATLCVHAIKSRATAAEPWVRPAASWTARLALVAALVAAAWLDQARGVALAACIPLAAVLIVDRLALRPRRLKQVGWTIVATNALALAALALAP